jgi:hypothetical protein
MSIPAIEKFMTDLSALGYVPELVTVNQNQHFAILRNFTIELGKFEGRMIDLGLPALTDYPRRVGQAIHVKAEPQLLEKQHIANTLNIIDSPLGDEWRYWSYKLVAYPEGTAIELMNQISGIFKRV